MDSSLFADNAFTVVNFWFSGCKPCVAELGDLDKLNQTVKAQGGEVIGINTENARRQADAIATAKTDSADQGGILPQHYLCILAARQASLH